MDASVIDARSFKNKTCFCHLGRRALCQNDKLEAGCDIGFRNKLHQTRY